MKKIFICTLSAICTCFFQDTFSQSIFSAKYGISDLAFSTPTSIVTNGADSLLFEEENSSRTKSIGIDFLVPLDLEKKRHYFDIGLYYGSSTLIGNPSFRYRFVYAANAVQSDSTIDAEFKYGNLKLGYGYNLSRNKRFLFLPVIGLDLEYGETVFIQSDFTVTVVNGQIEYSNLFVNNSLLAGFYFRMHMGYDIKNGWGLLFTPGIKYVGRFEDDFENDKTNSFPARWSFDFTAGILKRFGTKNETN